MKILFYIIPILFLANFVNAGFVVNHTSTDLDNIPNEWITKAKQDMHGAYNHTSHGSQLISGMDALERFPNFGSKYAWVDNSHGDTSNLSLDDRGITGVPDLSQGDGDSDGDGIANWAEDTYDFLIDANNEHINVIMWSWCNISGHDIDRYIRSMEWLIAQFSTGGSTYTDAVMTTPATPHSRVTDHPVQFVFMTAHANGGGEGDSSDAPNEQIRAHVQAYDRILFDFSDIENYDPDNNYYLNKRLDDALYYDSTLPYDSGSRDANWASEFLTLHDDGELDRLTTGNNVSGYSGVSSCAHSPEGGETSDARLNCVLKGRASWHLFARLVGWNGGDADTTAPIISEVTPVPSPTKDSTPDYTFNTDENGTITYGGSCDSTTTNAITGDNTITLNTLTDGTYSNCTIQIDDAAGNTSNLLDISEFTIDITIPTLIEITPIGTTNDTTPNYIFNASEAGTITYGGSCNSVTTNATTEDNTITLNKLSSGTYNDCTITVTDSAGNPSNLLTISTFTLE
jgi:heat shock protein HslJ